VILASNNQSFTFELEVEALLLTTEGAYELVEGRRELCEPFTDLWLAAARGYWISLQIKSEDGDSPHARFGSELVPVNRLCLRANGTAALLGSPVPGRRDFSLTSQGWLGWDREALASSVTIAPYLFFEPRLEIGARTRLSALAAAAA
jgi:hypothetical protein